MCTIQHSRDMISNSTCNFPGTALSAFYLEIENEIKISEKHTFYCIKKDLTFKILLGGGERETRQEMGKKLIILEVPFLGANPKHWLNSILYNGILEKNNIRNLCIIDAG